jgi:SH3-like domain-containing protein
VLRKLVIPANAGTQRKKKNWVPAFAGMTIILASAPVAAQEKQPPYWASIASGEAMTRTGPGKTYPGVWLYKRRDLPVRVVK